MGGGGGGGEGEAEVGYIDSGNAIESEVHEGFDGG